MTSPFPGYPNATHISPHLSRKEAYCHCGCKPSAAILANMVAYSIVFEKTRAANGGTPVGVNCLFRCPKHNATLPGAAPRSQHLEAKASDNTPGKGTFADLVKYAMAALSVPEVRGISIYEAAHGGFVHTDTRSGPKWFALNGNTISEARFRRILAAGKVVA